MGHVPQARGPRSKWECFANVAISPADSRGICIVPLESGGEKPGWEGKPVVLGSIWKGVSTVHWPQTGCLGLPVILLLQIRPSPSLCSGLSRDPGELPGTLSLPAVRQILGNRLKVTCPSQREGHGSREQTRSHQHRKQAFTPKATCQMGVDQRGEPRARQIS